MKVKKAKMTNKDVLAELNCRSSSFRCPLELIDRLKECEGEEDREQFWPSQCRNCPYRLDSCSGDTDCALLELRRLINPSDSCEITEETHGEILEAMRSYWRRHEL